jgi:hypothetical protein
MSDGNVIAVSFAQNRLIGSLFDAEDAEDEGSVLAAISDRVGPGMTVVIAEVSE